MKYQHVKRSFRSPFYVNLKKHYCPECKVLLGKTKVFRIVNSNSPEAKSFDLFTFDNYMIGNVKFIWTEFICPQCHRQISVNDMRRIEKEYRKTSNEKL